MNSLTCTRVHALLRVHAHPKNFGARCARAFLINLVPPNSETIATRMH